MSNEILKVGAPMPVSMGRCADLYHDVRELRLAMEKEVAEIQAREAEIKAHIINNLSSADGDTGAAGLRYRAQVVSKKKPIIAPVSDIYAQGGWRVFCNWVASMNRFDMLQKRLSDKAVMDWMDQEKKVIPGLEIMNVKDVSVTKI